MLVKRPRSSGMEVRRPPTALSSLLLLVLFIKAAIRAGPTPFGRIVPDDGQGEVVVVDMEFVFV